jgi:hypothetical protein
MATVRHQCRLVQSPLVLRVDEPMSARGMNLMATCACRHQRPWFHHPNNTRRNLLLRNFLRSSLDSNVFLSRFVLKYGFNLCSFKVEGQLRNLAKQWSLQNSNLMCLHLKVFCEDEKKMGGSKLNVLTYFSRTRAYDLSCGHGLVFLGGRGHSHL